MKLLFTNVRIGRAHQRPSDDVAPTAPASTASSPSASSTSRSASSDASGNDDSLGRGMDAALTMLVFLGIGWLIDRWLGVFPAFTIGLVLFAAAGSFVRLKYTYDARMEQLEADRANRRRSSVGPIAGSPAESSPSGPSSDVASSEEVA
jgi:F0F1-type ATP synthase assembly protein I